MGHPVQLYLVYILVTTGWLKFGVKLRLNDKSFNRKGEYTKVPMIFGVNSEEGILYTAPYIKDNSK